MKLTSVITTIQEPTPSVLGLVEILRPYKTQLVVIGDQKGPKEFDLPGTDFYSLGKQLRLPFSLANILPTKHYARKNLGYLIAISCGSTCIYETDDDNMPFSNWKPLSLKVTAQKCSPRPWLNVYRLFSKELIWPRGFPLERIWDPATYDQDELSLPTQVVAPIQQGLVDLSPDVDAVWRMVLGRDFYFDKRSSVWLPPGTWCPFNSQNTWWWPDVYPLMYLPSYCSFRMTDIWRSFIAQRCLWELNAGVVFHGADAVQKRNTHNFMQDFKDEFPGYVGNEAAVRNLMDLPLQPGFGSVEDNLIHCYEKLVKEDFFLKEELCLLSAWLKDIKTVSSLQR